MSAHWIFILIAIFFVYLWLKLRRRKQSLPEKPKETSFNAKRIFSRLAKGTPLSCLLRDGRYFGLSFSEKEPPVLPCCEGCRCRIEETVFRNSEVFDKPKNSSLTYESDLGELNFREYKYYKYSLILHDPQIEEEQAASFEEIREQVEVPDEFKIRVADHLNGANSSDPS